MKESFLPAPLLQRTLKNLFKVLEEFRTFLSRKILAFFFLAVPNTSRLALIIKFLPESSLESRTFLSRKVLAFLLSFVLLFPYHHGKAYHHGVWLDSSGDTESWQGVGRMTVKETSVPAGSQVPGTWS